MKRLLIAVALVALAGPAWAQTATPVTAATPSNDGSTTRSQAKPANPGKQTWADAQTFEGGVQIGTTGNGASLLTFVARGNCLADPSASLGDGAETIVSCAVPGAATGDFVAVQIQDTDDLTDVYVKRARAFTNSVQFSVGSYTAAQNPGSLTFNYLVVR